MDEPNIHLPFWRRKCHPYLNISLSRSVWVSTIFGVNCAWVAMKITLAGIG
jgi:hypothetical protein